MAPIRTTGRLLASTLNARSASSSLPIQHSSSTIPVPSSPSHTPITPSIAFHRVTRVLLEHFNTRRDDDDTTTSSSDKHLNLIFPIVVGAIILGALWGCSRDHFKRGGTWKTYAKGWLTAFKFFLLVTVFLPLTILGCVIGCHNSRKAKRPGQLPNRANNRRRGAAAPAVATNPLAGTGAPPPPLNRPQMPLDPVVVMPDLPDQEDPDAVMALPLPPPPILQRNETTDEATDRFLQEDKK